MLASSPRIAMAIAISLFCAGCLGLDDPALELESDSASIVGGADTEIGTVPWQVSLQTAGGQHFCGGTIVAPEWIVTAAHCVEGIAPARIVAGSTRLSQPELGQVAAVTRAITVPGYADPTVGKDLALLELAAPLTLDETVRAIRPLSDAEAELAAPGVLSTVSGWGTLTAGGSSPDVLQSVEVPIVSLADASADYGMSLTADQLAAGVRGVGGKDACQGDSGGPLVIEQGGEVRLAGVVSWGEGCADPSFPGMYARASSFFSFLYSHIGGAPTAVAGADQIVALGAEVTLDAGDSVEVGIAAIVEYSWSQTAGPPVDVELDGAVARFIAPDEEGELELEVTVVDSGGGSSTDRVSVTVSRTAPEDPDEGGEGGEASDGGTLVGGCSAGAGGGGLAATLLALVALGRVRRREA
jgi:MYXO-CTERM domain-containing protein